MTTSIKLTFTQCKQIIENGVDLRDFVERVNDQPDFMSDTNFGMGIDSIGELQAVVQSGCASNAHRSVFYYDANKCMSEHGDSVLEYIENNYGEIPAPKAGVSWTQMGSDYLSMAIELWCGNFADDLNGVDWD